MDQYSTISHVSATRVRGLLDPALAGDAVNLNYLQNTVPFSLTRSRCYIPFLTTTIFAPLGPNNSGGSITAPADATAPFGINLSRGTTAANRAAISSSLAMFHFGMVSRAYIEFYVKVRTAMPDATNDYTLNLGFCDSTTADPVDGAYWALIRTTSTTNWVCCTANNSTRTLTNSGIAVTLNTVWYRLGIEVLDIGGGTRNARFYNNGVLSQTLTTNIPTTAGREFGINFLLRGIAGTTDRLVGMASCFYDLTYTALT